MNSVTLVRLSIASYTLWRKRLLWGLERRFGGQERVFLQRAKVQFPAHT